MTDLSLLYGGDDNLLGDNMDNSYSTQKINKMSNNDMSIEDKSSKSQQIMLQTQYIFQKYDRPLEGCTRGSRGRSRLLARKP